MRLLQARGVESEAEVPFAGLLELLRPALARARRDPGAAGGCARRRAGARPGERRRSVRDRRGHAQPALGLCRGGAARRCSSTTRTGSTRSSAEALLFAFRRLRRRSDRGVPRRAGGRAVAARRRRSADAPRRAASTAPPPASCSRGCRRGRRSRVRRDRRQPACAARARDRRLELAMAPVDAPVPSRHEPVCGVRAPARSPARRRRGGCCSCSPRATRAIWSWLARAAAEPRPGRRGSDRRGGGWPASTLAGGRAGFRHPLVALGGLRRGDRPGAARSARRPGRRAPRPGRRPACLAPGRGRGRPGRGRVRRPRAGRRPRPGSAAPTPLPPTRTHGPRASAISEDARAHLLCAAAMPPGSAGNTDRTLEPARRHPRARIRPAAARPGRPAPRPSAAAARPRRGRLRAAGRGRRAGGRDRPRARGA